MQLAKIENSAIVQIANYKQMFPNVSFAIGGPSDDFLQENSVKKVRSDLPYNPNTQILVPAEPYILNEFVYDVVIQDIPAEQIQQAQQARLQSLIRSFTFEAQARLDAFANERGYDNILSACSYATSAVPRFAADGVFAAGKRDQWWLILNQICQDVVQGNRPEPDKFEDLLPELPELIWTI